jgi:hypothetical protein
LSQYITKDGDVITINYTGTGNAWFTYNLLSDILQSNFIRVLFNISDISGSFRLWIFGKNSSGSAVNVAVKDFSANGDYAIDIDLNYYAVYGNIDLTKPIQIGIGNTSHPSYCKVTGFSGINIITTLDTGKTFLDNLNDINDRSISNEVGISQLSSLRYLTSGNGTKYTLSVSNDGTISAVPTIPHNTLFVGNSLLLGNGTFGMAASDSSHDYYYYITQQILSKDSTATFDKLHGSNFEDCTSVQAAQTWMANTLLPHLGNDVNLVIVQLGDNVNNADKRATFNTSCGLLLEYIREHAPNARVAWAGEWYATQEKQELIANACADSGCVFIDISNLRNQSNESYIGAVINYGTSASRTYAFDTYSVDTSSHMLSITFTSGGRQYTSIVPYDTYSVSGSNITITGNYGFINNSGVASHPGNSGMLAIANKMMQALGLD